jgi:nucleoside-diphosphate-sugar epimerase
VGLPDAVDDWTYQHPQNSYGVAKVVGEQLLNDYSRKGFVDGRGVRLPAIVVRDEPNPAASEYASALVREPVAGRNYVCPVAPSTRMPILSLRQAVEVLVLLGELPEGRLGDYRTINGVAIAPSAEEIADAVRHCGAPNLGTIDFDPDPEIGRIVAGWPKEMRFDRAKALGLRPDASIEAIVDDYLRVRGKMPEERQRR